MNLRIEQLDFLKGVLILQVIMIHLVYLGQSYPTLKHFLLLYTTPSFFFISGYLASFHKPKKEFMKKVLGWTIPYLIMETGYIIMASILPIKEHIDLLNPTIWIYHLGVKSLGPYWYIHDLIVCYLIYFLLSKSIKGKYHIILKAVGALALFTIMTKLQIISMTSCLFFSLGVLLRLFGIHFLHFIHPSWFSLPMVIIACYLCSSLTGMEHFVKSIILSYAMMSVMTYIYAFLPHHVATIFNKIGRNTLAILLFSPMFTIVTKQFVPLFAFDKTLLMFTTVSVAFTTTGSLGIAYLLDRLHLSPYFCGKSKFLV